MRQPEYSAAARVSAAIALLDRGWGKPAQSHTGEDGEGAVTFTIRHILESRDAPRVVGSSQALEHAPIDAAPDDADET